MIAYKLLVSDRNIWNHKNVCKPLVLEIFKAMQLCANKMIIANY